MQRSLLVQALLNMATGNGGAKLEALVVDAAGTFDAGSGKGYNPVTVPSGSVNVLGEKGVVSNNSVVVTPKAQVVGGWVNSGETSGTGVGVTASELVSGTLNVSSDGVQDVTNYQNISVPSAGHSASAHKGVVTDHSIIVTPRSTATQGFVQAGTVEGTPVSVAASELVSGSQSITSNGIYDVTNLSSVDVSVASSLSLVFSGDVIGSNNHNLNVPYSGDFAKIQVITVGIVFSSVTLNILDVRTGWWFKGYQSSGSRVFGEKSDTGFSASQSGTSILLAASNQSFRFNSSFSYNVRIYA